jgi:hypothetical protein
MRIKSPGHAAFAMTMIALGVLGLIKGDFVPVWAPVPKAIAAREVLVYLTALISVGCGIGLLWQRAAALAARVLLGSLVLWLVLLRGRDVLRAPTAQSTWSGWGETAVMVAGAWVLCAWFATARDTQRVPFATGDRGVRLARVLYGLALLPFGSAHFVYLKETASLVPRWLPAHVAVAYFTGGAFLAAGVAVLARVYARLAAALSAVQIGLFTLLVWVPILAAGSKDAFQWSEGILSWALTTGAWVVADSYRGTRAR